MALPHASRIGDLRAGSRARSARPFTISKLASHALRTTNSHSLQFLLFRRRLNRCRSNGARKSTDRGRATREVCLRGTCACKRAHRTLGTRTSTLGSGPCRGYSSLQNACEPGSNKSASSHEAVDKRGAEVRPAPEGRSPATVNPLAIAWLITLVDCWQQATASAPLQ